MASSIDGVGKRCAAVEQGHHDLEAHFVNFMSDPRVETHPKRNEEAAKKQVRDFLEMLGKVNLYNHDFEKILVFFEDVRHFFFQVAGVLNFGEDLLGFTKGMPKMAVFWWF